MCYSTSGLRTNLFSKRAISWCGIAAGLLLLGGCDSVVDVADVTDIEGNGNVIINGQRIRGQIQAKRKETTTRSLQAASITVQTRNGGIEIRQSPEAQEITIDVDFRAGGSSKEDAQKRVELAKCQIEEKEGGLVLSAHFPTPARSGDGASIRVTVPELKEVNATTTNGEVDVSGAAGAIRIDTTNGAIKVQAAGSSAHCTSTNGSVEVEFEQDATGPVHASSTNGNVGVKVGSAFTGSLQCSTTNGRIRFSDPKERATHSNIQGNSGSVTLPGAGDSVLETTNGNIELSVD